IKRNHNLIATASVVGLNLAAAYILITMFGGHFVPSNVMGLFMIDPFTLIYQLLIIVASLACCTLSHAYIETYKDNREELYLLLLISVSG
ncbi:NADH-quinone oxidoreductase subunit N, partial [Pseudomonas aeruginosa]